MIIRHITPSLLVIFSCLIWLAGCGDPPGEQQPPGAGASGVITFDLASASEISFIEAAFEASGVAVQECAPDGTGDWHEVELEESLIVIGETKLTLPELERGAELCSLRVEPETSLNVLGEMTVGAVVESFALEMKIREMQFDFIAPEVVSGETGLALVVQLAQADWTSPDFIGVPPEPKRGVLIEIGPSDPRHSVLCQQVFRFSRVFVDPDGDGLLTNDEVNADFSSPPVGGPAAMRTEPGMVALGSPRCLDGEGAEVDCASGDVDTYSPALWVAPEEGADWLLVETRPSFPAPVTLSDVAHDGEFFVAVGQTTLESGQDEVGTLVTSLAGVVWGGWLRGAPLHGVTKGAGDRPWVAVGAACGRLHSTDGVVWSDSSCDQDVVVYRDVTWTEAGPGGDGMYVAVGDEGQWAWSKDGSSWIEGGSLSHPDGASGLSGFREVTVLSDGRVVAVGIGGDIKVLENPDELASAAATWSDLVAPFNPDLTDVIAYSSQDSGEEIVLAVGFQSGPVLTVVDLAADGGPFVDNVVLSTGHLESLVATGKDTFVGGGNEGLWTWFGDPQDATPPVALQEELVTDDILKVIAYTPQ
jgi:hypothetical protein